MVRDGVVVVVPLYFAVLLNAAIIMVDAPLLKVHDTDWRASFGEETVHCKVTDCPVVPE